MSAHHPASPLHGPTFHIDGVTLGYPTEFRAGSSMMGMFVVPSGPMRALLDPSGLPVAEVAPGRTLLALNCVHYTDTDCGSYEEIAWSGFVTPPSATSRVPYLPVWRRFLGATIGSFAWRLAVTTTLSRDAGLQMWGFPKTQENLGWTEADGSATMSWHGSDGRDVMAFTAPATGSRTPKTISPPVFGVLDGRLQAGHLTQTYEGVGYHRKGVHLELGTHPIADELRSLGLPKRPLAAIWNTKLRFMMSAPTPGG